MAKATGAARNKQICREERGPVEQSLHRNPLQTRGVRARKKNPAQLAEPFSLFSEAGPMGHARKARHASGTRVHRPDPKDPSIRPPNGWQTASLKWTKGDHSTYPTPNTQFLLGGYLLLVGKPGLVEFIIISRHTLRKAGVGCRGAGPWWATRTFHQSHGETT